MLYEYLIRTDKISPPQDEDRPKASVTFDEKIESEFGMDSIYFQKRPSYYELSTHD